MKQILSDEPYLSQIMAILNSILQDKTCEIYLFGSRATRTHSPLSDFDIAVLATEDISRELSLAREKLELSKIPLKVDLVDLSTTSDIFKQKALTEGILL